MTPADLIWWLRRIALEIPICTFAVMAYIAVMWIHLDRPHKPDKEKP